MNYSYVPQTIETEENRPQSLPHSPHSNINIIEHWTPKYCCAVRSCTQVNFRTSLMLMMYIAIALL